MKYDSVNDALKMSQAHYRMKVSTAVGDIQDETGILGTSVAELREAAKEYASDHEFFDEFDGATYGAMVEWCEQPETLTRWTVETETQAGLEEMAREAFEADIIAKVVEHKSEFEDVPGTA